MSKHFNLMDFLRRAPRELLATYCDRQGILRSFDWGPGKPVPAERVNKLVEVLPEQCANCQSVSLAVGVLVRGQFCGTK